MMSHRDSLPIIGQMMRDFLQVPEGTNLSFTEPEFLDAVNSLSAEDYAAKREAIAAFRLHETPEAGDQAMPLRDNE